MNKLDTILLFISVGLFMLFVFLSKRADYSYYAECKAAGGIPPQCLYYDFYEMGKRLGAIQEAE